MLQGITVVVHLTGLLLMAPDSAVGSNHTPKLPMHLLMPTIERTDIKPHYAQLGTLPQDGRCIPPFALTRVNGHRDMCWVSLDGWSAEIGHPGPSPSTNAPLPDHTPVLGGSQGHPVPRHLFGPLPGSKLRSRVTLNFGQAAFPCAFGWWRYPTASDTVLIASVVDWSFQSDTASMQTLTATLLNDSAKTTPPVVLDLPRPQSGRLDLFVRYVPRKVLDGEHEEGRRGETLGHHLHAFYDLLGYGPTQAERPIPVYQSKNPSCPYDKFMDTPNSPTCMMGIALP